MFGVDRSRLPFLTNKALKVAIVILLRTEGR